LVIVIINTFIIVKYHFCSDQWDLYKPKTNIYWLHYVLDKMLNSVHYRKTSTVVHLTGMKALLKFKNVILSFDSAKSFAVSDMILNLLVK